MIDTTSSDLLPVDWIDSFDPAKYSALRSLLLREDFEFFRRQQGFDPALHRRLRKERIAIAWSYLHQLESDVRKLIQYGRAVVACSPADDDRLSLILLNQEMRLKTQIFAVRMRLTLYSLGLLCEVRFGPILDPLTELVQQVNVAIPAA